MSGEGLNEELRRVVEAAADAVFQRDELVAVLRSPFSDAAKVALMAWEAFGMSGEEWAERCPEADYEAATEWAFGRDWSHTDTEVRVWHTS